MPIKVLTPEVISKIAAGEVVERPASVVKELVENSLDAGASSIAIEVQGGGVSLLRVTDNGTGIPSDEIVLAFTRHATSKLSTSSDLENISTLGFRGEALPSIVAVSDVDIITQASSEPSGTHIKTKNGAISSTEKRSRPPGTSVTVQYLFRYVPARLKFLKSSATENGHIANLITQYALAFPEVKFSLSIDRRLSLHTSGNGNLRDIIADIYGIQVARKMLAIREADRSVAITGMISPPDLTRTNRSYLSFFVNRRWVRSTFLVQAVLDAYHGLLMVGRYPLVVINISMPPREIDANVHPTKTEVKFHSNQIIYATVRKAIRDVVAEAPLPSLHQSVPVAAPPSLFSAEMERSAFTRPDSPSSGPSPVEDNQMPMLSLPALRVLGQLASCYILAEGPEGLYLVDQHAAHERIIFEKILAQRSDQNVDIQGLLDPLTIELNPQQQQVLSNKKELIGQFGFDLEPFGDRSYLLRAVPAVARDANLSDALLALLDSIGNVTESVKQDEAIAITLACHGAITAGKTLTGEEMRELIRQLEQTENPKSCPHGRPTMVHLSARQLEKEFGRTG